mmetsp:Transcript_19447/g.45133  ORF Transcript_19447/g.45133 Transcript_19447/m.45133 type:complete len:202 (-) Transcript_19447:834-1439(-)
MPPSSCLSIESKFDNISQPHPATNLHLAVSTSFRLPSVQNLGHFQFQFLALCWSLVFFLLFGILDIGRRRHHRSIDGCSRQCDCPLRPIVGIEGYICLPVATPRIFELDQSHSCDGPTVLGDSKKILDCLDFGIKRQSGHKDFFRIGIADAPFFFSFLVCTPNGHLVGAIVNPMRGLVAVFASLTNVITRNRFVSFDLFLC